MAMLTVVYIGGKSIAKSLMSGLIGYALSMVGTDPVQGAPRFVYGQPYLMDGVSFVVVVMGLFGITECLVSVEERMKMSTLKVPFRDCFPTFRDIIDSAGAILRGTFIGFCCGVLPGAGSTLSSFLSYGVEKSMSNHPERFGKGAIEGVAGPETANNAACSGEMVPLLSIGIPSSGSNAMLLGGMILCGLRPGPLLFQTNPEFVWTIIANLFIANFILLIMNLPMVPLFAMTLRIPYSLLYPAIFIVCVIGAYSMNSDPTDVGLMFLFGGIGYFLRKCDIPGAPMIIALVLGKMFENALYQALNLSRGDLSTFVTRPISATLLAIAAALTVIFMFKSIRQKRKLLEEEQM
jgi:putative tricarboxylic transport membrane protein